MKWIVYPKAKGISGEEDEKYVLELLENWKPSFTLDYVGMNNMLSYTYRYNLAGYRRRSSRV